MTVDASLVEWLTLAVCLVNLVADVRGHTVSHRYKKPAGPYGPVK